ncbi:MAG: zinc ABC transporter substrate-binding protein [Proteobacteria bacterium]|nr:zinc ABC transporter substrate-binding protein [Pseudomonadota bacterium]
MHKPSAMHRHPGLALILVAAALAGFAAAGNAHADGPRVVVSIKPVHAIVAAVMAGVAAPELLVKGGGSPHTYAMRPSQARSLNDAELVFWVGGNLETFLRKPLSALAGKARLIKLMAIEGMTLYPTRAGGAWERHAEQAPQDAAHGALDAHVWLDPANAKRIASAAAAALTETDPANRAAYAANAERFAARIDALDAELRAALAPLKHVPYAVFHDAYQYFEQRYGLNAVGAVTISPERRPGARRLRQIRATIRAFSARCVFHEPQFEPALLQNVVEGTGARVGVLDPLGAELEPGADAYFALMRGLARGLAECLEAGR